MCDPLTIAGLALTAGSFVTSAIANNQVEDARNAAAVAEATRQDQLQRQAIANLQGTQEQFTRPEQEKGIDEVTQERIARLTENVQGAAGDANEIPLAGSTPRVVRETVGQGLSEGLAEGKDFASRLARVGAFGENQFNNRVALGRLGEQLGLTARESANSANILPVELQEANRAGNTLFGISDALGGLGSIANLGSATGANLFGSPKPQAFPIDLNAQLARGV